MDVDHTNGTAARQYEDTFSVARQMRVATRCRVFRSKMHALERRVAELETELEKRVNKT